jgi:hypothetical protein
MSIELTEDKILPGPVGMHQLGEFNTIETTLNENNGSWKQSIRLKEDCKPEPCPEAKLDIVEIPNAKLVETSTP